MNLPADTPVHEHHQHGPPSVACAVITISDSRRPETDSGGDLLVQGLTDAGHRVAHRNLVPDEPERIRAAVGAALARPELRVILCTGGTGIAPRDRTVDTLAPLFEQPLPGFGELFRFLSFQEIGPAAMLSRATAGVVQGRLVFLLPGSPGALRLALEKLVLPELGHIAGLLTPRKP